MKLVVSIRTVSELNERGHWSKRAKRAKEQRNTIGAVVYVTLKDYVLAECVAVTLTRVAPGSGLDDDNLRGALKACRDGVADALGVDDRDPRVEWRYAQRRGKPREYAVEIAVEAA